MNRVFWRATNHDNSLKRACVAAESLCRDGEGSGQIFTAT